MLVGSHCTGNMGGVVVGPELHVKKDTFLELCEDLVLAREWQSMQMRDLMTYQKHVATILWKLVAPDCYRAVGIL